MPDREMTKYLRAMRDPLPPPDLAVRLERGIPEAFRRRERAASKPQTAARLAVTAAGLALLAWAGLTLLRSPAGPGVSLAAVLEPVAEATGEAPAVHLVVRVLSREGEDFGIVDPEAPAMLTYEAWIEMPRGAGGPGRARVRKGGREYACDGSEMVLWFPQHGEAIRSAGCAIERDLFWPEDWIRQIGASQSAEMLGHAQGRGRATLLLREPGVVVEGRAPAHLREFDRETEIDYDTGTRRLAGLKRWVVAGGRRLVWELASIEYLPAADADLFRPSLPRDVRWVSLKDAPDAIAAMGPREVALRFLQAAVDGDRALLELLGASPHAAETISRMGIGAVESVGEPFRTGLYPGVFVPYAIRLGRGETARPRRHNLALRNDNDQRRWVYDGGI